MSEITSKQVQDSFDWILKNAPMIGRAKSMVYVWEQGLKSKKAELKIQAVEKTQDAKEDFALNHKEYKDFLIQTAKHIEEYESLKVMEKYNFAILDVWRSQEASNRNLERKTK